MKLVVAQKEIRPSWKKREVHKDHCYVCEVPLNNPMYEGEFTCHDNGGPPDCNVLTCNAHWFDHDKVHDYVNVEW